MSELQHIADWWEAIQRSDIARREDDIEALKQLDKEALVHMAWRAFNEIKRLNDDGYDYLIGAIEDHIETPGPGSHVVSKMQCMWVIAQSDGGDNAGGFNKWCKTIGGWVPEAGPSGDSLLFENWHDAKAAYDHMHKNNPEVARCFKIYPVVAIAGNEPRLTAPRKP